MASDHRWCLIGVLTLAAVLYLYRLDVSGYANSYYAAAAQAGSTSWKAFFYGSLDGGNFITVDKPPAALWFMALSVRLFGLSSWSILVPQALMGVGSVALLYVAVRRWHGPVAGLVAATSLAVTPVATLIFRFNNPDALLTLVVIAAAYATMRAVDSAQPRWSYVVGALIGLAFLTKLMQAFVVVPAFALTYITVTPGTVLARIGHLARAAIGIVVVAGSWLAMVTLTPPTDRPWIGSTSTNDMWDLTIGYNGIGRLTGNENAGNAHVVGDAGGILRMFGSRMLVDASWLLIAAVICAIGGLWLRRKAPRTDRTRAGLIMWGTWLGTCVVVFSGMSGIFHTYYAVELAPAVAALFGIGSTMLWQRRRHPGSTAIGALAVSATIAEAVIAFLLNPGFAPWVMWAVLVVGAICIAGWLVYPLTDPPPGGGRFASRALAAATVVVCLASPMAFSVSTALTGRVGSSISSGPNGSGRDLKNNFDCTSLVPMLDADSARFTWVAAARRVRIPEGCQLATGHPVMAIGGFYGRDPAPTLQQFVDLVHDHKVHFYLEYPGRISPAADPADQIQQWVRDHYRPRRVDSINVYDLTATTAHA